VDWMHVAEDRDHGSKPWGSIKGGQFLDSGIGYQRLKDSSPRRYLVSC
jgi:hypothetical protein